MAAMEAFAKQEQIPVGPFRKGQRQDDVAAEPLRRFDKTEGVLFIGKAQEKTPVFRTERRRNDKTGARYPWLVPATALVNPFYLYGVDRDFGPFFLKFSTYFPDTPNCACTDRNTPNGSGCRRGSLSRLSIRTCCAAMIRGGCRPFAMD
jgi:hypothetical protein